MKMIALAIAAAAAALSGCAATAPFHEELPLAQGPAPQMVRETHATPLVCVASSLSPRARSVAFGVIDFPDNSGAVNHVGNDSFGTFNTQGAGDMLISSLSRAGIKVVELSPAYRELVNWSTIRAGQHQGHVRTIKKSGEADPAVENLLQVNRAVTNLPAYGLKGSITTTDFLPGGGVNGGVLGAHVGYNQNRAHISIDLRAIQMPNGSRLGGNVPISVSVTKQVVQDAVQVNLTRYIELNGLKIAKPTLLEFEAGAERREPMKFSTRAMVDLAAAAILSHLFKVTSCDNEPIVVAAH